LTFRIFIELLRIFFPKYQQSLISEKPLKANDSLYDNDQNLSCTFSKRRTYILLDDYLMLENDPKVELKKSSKKL